MNFAPDRLHDADAAERGAADRRLRAIELLQDSAFLVGVELLSLVLYVGALGFYSDDWDFLARCSTSGDKSLLGLFRSLNTDQVRMRPVQVLDLALLYRCFGLNPLGYHLANAAVMSATVVLFYLCLRELKQSRLLAVSIPLVFGLLPNYCTDRFWMAASHANVSMALYFLSLLADLKVTKALGARRGAWKVLAVASLLGSVLAYEITLPFFLVNIALGWYLAPRREAANGGARVTRALLAANLVALFVAVLFKATTTVRASGPASYVANLSSVFVQAVVLNYGSYGLAFPRVVWRVLALRPDGLVLATGALVGIATFFYLWRVSKAEPRTPGPRFWAILAALGLPVLALGYAVFATTSEFLFAKAGIANRIGIGGAVGAAMSCVGALGLASALLPRERLRRLAYCGSVALVCGCCCVIVNVIASFWVAAYEQEQAVLADVRERISSVPAGGTLLLDGVCPYVGPAIVFESNWDLAGALRAHGSDPGLKADVVKRRTEVREDGIVISIYRFENRYEYGEKLLIYDYPRKTLHTLGSADAARAYFGNLSASRDVSCPAGAEGTGVPIF